MTGQNEHFDDQDPLLTREDFEEEWEYQSYLAVENMDLSDVVIEPEIHAKLKSAVDGYMKNERERISISVSKRNLAKLKARALEQGMPYQTLINSILHQWLAGTNEASTIAPPSRSAEGKTKETVNQ